MRDPRLHKLANLIVQYSLAVHPGDKVAIRSLTPAEPLLNELYAQVVAAGGYPYLALKFPDTEERYLENATEEQLARIPEVEQYVVDHFDALIMIRAESNTRSLNAVPASRLLLARRAEGPLMQRLMQRAAEGTMRWVSLVYPTCAYAQEARMGLEAYEDFALCACLGDPQDPIGHWRQVEARQARIIDWLSGKEQVHILAQDTDLQLSIAGRHFMNACCKHNIPDGEIYTGPVETSVQGHVRFSFPAVYAGHELTGVQLWFEDGRVVQARADQNEEFLLAALETDECAHYLGEFAIGTNDSIDRFTGQILFDEKIGGSFHLALGNSYPETGSRNRSAIHWDLICDLRRQGSIRVDDELFYEKGKFLLE